MELTEKTNSQKRVFTGRLIHVRHDKVTLPDGTETIREVVEHPGGVAIAALTDQNELLLVDQVMRGEIIDGKTIAMTLKLQKLLEEEE